MKSCNRLGGGKGGRRKNTPVFILPNININTATSSLIRLIADHMKCSSSILQALMVAYTFTHLTGMASVSCAQQFPKTHLRKIKCFHLYMNCLGWQQLLSLSLGGQILSDVHEITQKHRSSLHLQGKLQCLHCMFFQNFN